MLRVIRTSVYRNLLAFAVYRVGDLIWRKMESSGFHSSIIPAFMANSFLSPHPLAPSHSSDVPRITTPFTRPSTSPSSPRKERWSRRRPPRRQRLTRERSQAQYLQSQLPDLTLYAIHRSPTITTSTSAPGPALTARSVRAKTSLAIHLRRLPKWKATRDTLAATVEQMRPLPVSCTLIVRLSIAY
ncbi:hypothetical protein BDZ89DRAFT_1148223 [Hymenopellis radicata]|nr:hypothetical protein BDZ89DRAFT_1148223 [Hymenopellis radicata]